MTQVDRPAGVGLAVLTYHAFGAARSVTTTDPGWFVETLDALKAAGFRGVDLGDWVARGRPDEPDGFALAFDDGLASVLNVADAVTSRGLPATVFVPTDRVGRDNDWPGQPSFVSRERLLDWSELRSLAASGFRVGSHGRTHARLDRLNDVGLAAELHGSCNAIEQRLGVPCPLLAYPYGADSGRVRVAAAVAYRAAFGTRLDYASASQNAFSLSRLDAFYLASRPSLDRLTSGRWGPTLRLRRAGRSVRRAVAGLGS